jgi:TonB family protein
MRIRIELCLIALTTLLPLACIAQDLTETLKPKLVGRTVELRIPAPDVQLTFDSGGKLKRAPSHGLRSIDAFIAVNNLKIQDSALNLEGERLVVIWDPDQRKTELSHTGLPVYLSIDLPNGAATSETEFVPTYYKIFYRPGHEPQCSPEENQLFANYAAAPGKKKKDLPRDSHSSQTVCFPGGNHVFMVGGDVKPPKAIKTPDPHYSESARAKMVQGTVISALAIDDTGLPTDAIVVRRLDPTLNYNSLKALRGWRFVPAQMDGKPVACTVKVEINFRLKHPF